MMVNNEIGAIEPIEEIAKIIKARIRIRFSMSMRFRHMETSDRSKEYGN